MAHLSERRLIPGRADAIILPLPALRGNIGVVLEGNFEEEPPTPMQVESLVALLAHLAEKYGIDPEEIEGHQHYAQTACPGKHLTALLPDIRRDVAARIAQ